MYQIFDFKSDVDLHINKNIPINLSNKSNNFKKFLFNLKLFYFNNNTIKMSNSVFSERYFLFFRNHKLYVAKNKNNKFDYVEIENGIKIIRKMKLRKIFI